MRIYNLFHGLKAPKVLSFGEFDVAVEQKHCSNLEKLARRSSKTFGYDDDLNPTVADNSAVRGEMVETGLLRFPNGKTGPSKLLPKVNGLTVAFDAILILSFLTGRRVYLEQELSGDVSHRYLDGAVDREFFVFWQGGELSPTRLHQEGLESAIYNVVNAYTAHELIGMAAYANFALEASSVEWAKRSGSTKFAASPVIARCRDAAVAWLENRLRASLLEKAKLRFMALLLGEDIEKRVIDDISKRLDANSAQPSAQHRLENFFAALGIVSSPPTDDEVDRIKKLNKLRNAIAHKGDINRRGVASEDLAASMAVGATLVTLEIAQYYIATRGLGLSGSSLDSTQSDLKAFFSSGFYHGQDMFGETYEDFIERAESEWIEHGHIDPRSTDKRSPRKAQRSK